jgi:GNAT superfamily N-acetyltransferase
LAQGRILVGVDEADEPVGFAIFDQFDSVVHLRELDVLPEHGGRGLGRQLVQAVIAWAIEHGCTAVTLTTFRDVPFNAPFYARAGFRVLTEDELTPRLAQIRAEERAHGIDLAPRVAMLRDLAGMTNQG